MNKKDYRQLLAVMFTDIVGYSAMMNENEKQAAKVRNIHREIFTKYHKTYNGNLIQYFGDGTLSVFKSAIEAVHCAIDIQKEMNTKHTVPLRIGLHIGDIVIDGPDVYGDGVNLASRIENICPAGSVLISDRIAKDLQNQQYISTKSLGLFELKNISAPVDLHAIVNEGLHIPEVSEFSKHQKKPENTIAVLPFVNMSSDPDAEYFSDGISEEIINALASIENLKVISRTSSFYFKNQKIPLKEVAEQLGVANILEGSIRLAKDMVRITAQLIQASDDFHFWSESWDRKMENIFEIQDEISLHIAEKLREQYGHFEIRDHLVEKQTNNIDAYTYSLKGRFYYNKWNPDDVKKAINFYKKALELDPSHTESYIGLSNSYGFMATTQFMPGDEAWPIAIENIHKAYALDPEHAGVHYQLANFSFFMECDYQNAARHIFKSLEVKPNYTESRQFMSFLYMLRGEMEEAYGHLQLALDIDPLNQETLFYKAYYLYRMGNYEESVLQLDECIEVNPKNLPAIIIRAYNLIKMSRYDEVLTMLETLSEDIVPEQERLGIQSLVSIYKNDDANAMKFMTKLKATAQDPTAFQAHSYLFLAYVNLGKNDEAFAWLEEALKLKSSILQLLYSDPLTVKLRIDARYQKYFKKLYQLEIQSGPDSNKKEPLLDQNTASEYTDKLLDFTHTEKPYLNPNLSLRKLADLVEIHSNHLSWILNEQIGKNFNEFINHFRVEHFKKLALDSTNAHFSLIGLAYESGFNSKTVFNTFFKKEVGMTPKEYVKSNQ